MSNDQLADVISNYQRAHDLRGRPRSLEDGRAGARRPCRANRERATDRHISTSMRRRVKRNVLMYHAPSIFS